MCCPTNKEVESTLPLCHGQRTICLKEGYNPNEYHQRHLAVKGGGGGGGGGGGDFGLKFFLEA